MPGVATIIARIYKKEIDEYKQSPSRSIVIKIRNDTDTHLRLNKGDATATEFGEWINPYPEVIKPDETFEMRMSTWSIEGLKARLQYMLDGGGDVRFEWEVPVVGWNSYKEHFSAGLMVWRSGTQSGSYPSVEWKVFKLHPQPKK